MPDIPEDELDRVLAAAATRIAPRTVEVDRELRLLAETTMKHARRERSRPRVAVWTAALGIVFAGGTAAAAAVGSGWAPWAETPDGTFSYTLPSGRVCEQRIGDIQAENPEVRASVREVFAEVDVVARADVAEHERRIRNDPEYLEYVKQTLDAGTSDLTSADDIVYSKAVTDAVLEVLDEELEARGFDGGSAQNLLQIKGQAICEVNEG